MERAENKYYRRNFLLGVVNGSLINVGMAFLDPFTVLPVFIMKLGGSAALVGFVSALHGVGWFLPQVFASRLAETRRYLMNLYRLAAIPRVLGFLGIALTVFLVDVSHKTVFLSAFVFTILFAYLAGGIAGVPMLEIVSKTIPTTRRGTFFGTRRFVGGILGIFAGMIVGVVLSPGTERMWMGGWLFEIIEKGVRGLGLVGHVFPVDFGIVFLLGAVCVSAGTVVFFFAGEPPAATVKTSARLLEHIRSGVALLREDPNYRRFYLVRICWQFTAMAFPFYASYAYDQLRVSEHMVGLFLSVWVGSGIFSNYVWGHLMDRKGNKIVLTVTAVLAAVPPLIVLGIDAWVGRSLPSAVGGGLLLLISSTFCINGFIRSGRLISNITYLLEFAPEAKRPLYVGFMNSFTFPFMLSPVIGGILIKVFNIQTLFWISLAFAAVNVCLSTQLREPRHRES